MATSPEIFPRVQSLDQPEIDARGAAAQAPGYDVPPTRTASLSPGKNRRDTNANSAMPYIFGVLALVVVGYLGYAYLWKTTSSVVPTNQSSTTVTPPVVPAPPATAPAATAPAASTTAPAVTVIPPAASTTVPAAPATPPAATTTP